jgi:hypothetical protein
MLLYRSVDRIVVWKASLKTGVWYGEGETALLAQ